MMCYYLNVQFQGQRANRGVETCYVGFKSLTGNKATET